MGYLNTGIFMGLSFWILGFALMTAGWLVDVLFEDHGVIAAKILYKTGAVIVAVPVIYLLWKVSRLFFTYRREIVIFLRDAYEQIQILLKAI